MGKIRIILIALFGIFVLIFGVFGKLFGGKASNKLSQSNSQGQNQMPIDPKLQNANARFNEEIRKLREQEREQKRRFSRIDWAWRFGSIGAAFLFGGLALDPLGGVAAIGIAILSGALVGWFGSLINNYIANSAKPQNHFIVPEREKISSPIVTSENMPNGRTELVQQVLNDATISLQKLDNNIGRLRHPESIAAVAQIVIVGKRLMNLVSQNPEKFSIAQRVFTYYCPESVRVAEALANLENEKNMDISRIKSTQSVLQKLSILFERTELEIKEDDNKALDIDIKLLDQSLQIDLSQK